MPPRTRKKTTKRTGATARKSSGRSTAAKPQRPGRRPRAARALIVRVATAPAVGAAAAPAGAVSMAAGAAADDVPEATIGAGAGPVSVEIVFGHAQHGAYTIQLFDAAGTELAREPGVSTDAIPDHFQLKPTPSQLNGDLLQWSGAVDAFSPAPGQQFSVLVDVTQNGAAVPGGHVEKTGPLTVTQAFLGILRLVVK